MLFALFLLVLGVLAKNPEEPSAEKVSQSFCLLNAKFAFQPVQSPAVKDGTAAGRYEGNGYGEGGGREHGYGGGEGSAEYEVAYGHSQRLVDGQSNPNHNFHICLSLICDFLQTTSATWTLPSWW
jgi:hypothetical protein